MSSFRYFVVGSGVTDKTQKRALLLHLVGPEVQQIFETLDNTGRDNDFDTAVEKLNGYFKPKKNVTFERHKFNSEEQKSDESVQDFATRLKQLALTCEFDDGNERIRDQIVQKCTSTVLRRKFLCEKTLTLEKVLELSSTFERAQDSAQKIENGKHNGQPPEGDNAYRLFRRNSKPHNTARSFQPQNPSVECYNCGRKGHLSKDPKCPAKNAKCRKCQHRGHFAVKCRTTQNKKSQPKRRVRNLDSSDTESEGEFTFTVKDRFGNSKITLDVGNVPLSMIIDSGATCNIVDINTWNFLKTQSNFHCISHDKTNKHIFAYGSKTPLKLAGTFRANVKYKQTSANNVEFTVLDGKGQSLLGKQTAIMLDVLRVGPQVCAIGSESIENKYPGLFSGMGKLKDFQMRIPIDDTVDPVIQPIRRVPYHLREKLERKLQSLEEEGIIEKVDTPSQWVSPVVIVPKGDDIRLCVDMRQANTAVKRVRHQIPTIEDVLQDMAGSKVFSKLDIKNAYHQIEIEKKSREITTFVTHTGQYRYKTLMFGVSCASELYQKVLQQILHSCKNAANIMDDIIVHGATKEEHDECLNQVLNVLSQKGFTLNREKCQFNMSELIFMGNVVSEHGVGPTKSKVQDVLDARTPTNASEVRSFLGLVNFNARYIPDLATISEPLRRLTRKNVKFAWEADQQRAFDELKKRLTSAETLGFYDKNAKTQVICDASPVGVGSVLLQETKAFRSCDDYVKFVAVNATPKALTTRDIEKA